MRLKFIVLTSIAFNYAFLSAQPVINFSDDNLTLIGQFCQTYAGDGSIEEILRLDDKNFTRNLNEHLLVGGSRPKIIWAKFTINNQHKEDVHLEIMNALIEKAKLYAVENNQVVDIQEYKREQQFSERKLYSNNPFFNLKSIDKPVTYYVQLNSQWLRNFKFRVGIDKAFFKEYYYSNLISGIFIGLITVFLFYNLFLYFRIKESTYLWYSLYLFFSSSFVLRHYGFLNEFLFQNHPQWNDYTLALMGIGGIFGVVFTMRILDSEKKLPNIHLFLLIASIVYGMSAIWALYGHFELSAMTGYFITPISTFIIVLGAINSWREGESTAIYYLMGWLVLSVGTVIFVMENFGKISYNNFTAYALHVGIALEAALLSLTIALKFSKIKSENDEIQQNMILVLQENERLIQEQNRLLENKVAEHTRELRSTQIKYNDSEIKLREYALKLEKSNRELTEFAHIASHDLKAPIRNIMSFVQLFERRHKANFDDTDKEYFKYIKTNAQQSARLIDDLLSYSKIDKNLGEPDEVDMKKCIFIAESNLQTLIRDRNAVVEHYNLPKLRGHSSLITQLFQNLINNGIKYNTSDKPHIIIKAEKSNEQGLVFSIKDNGIGIAVENYKTVFAMFRRLHSQSEYDGTGIGLAFCTRIVETYGGKMWLESTVGQGTTFYFTLPKAEAVEQELALA
jgi:signal transduction histidine kinase